MELVRYGSKQLETEETAGGENAEVKITEKDKRRLEILLKEETPELHVDPSIINRLNRIDRELNMLRGERLKESMATRCVSSDDDEEEDVLAICDNGWNEAQNRLDKIEDSLAKIQSENSSNQRLRLLPLRHAKNQLPETQHPLSEENCSQSESVET